jgi:hypothetical protein
MDSLPLGLEIVGLILDATMHVRPLLRMIPH